MWQSQWSQKKHQLLAVLAMLLMLLMLLLLLLMMLLVLLMVLLLTLLLVLQMMLFLMLLMTLLMLLMILPLLQVVTMEPPNHHRRRHHKMEGKGRGKAMEPPKHLKQFLRHHKLVVQLSEKMRETVAPQPSAPATFDASKVIATKVVVLLNMVTLDELKDPEEVKEIIEDTEEEAGKFGTVVSVHVPVPVAGQQVPGIEKVFVEYDSVAGAEMAVRNLGGRKFSDRVVVASYMDEAKYAQKDFS